jgi:hypothetical protein
MWRGFTRLPGAPPVDVAAMDGAHLRSTLHVMSGAARLVVWCPTRGDMMYVRYRLEQ